MTTSSEEFELSSSVLRGSTASASYHNSQSILRSEQRNPEAVFEVYATEPGVLSGMNEVMFVLRTRLPAATSGVLSLSDGDLIEAGETVLSITAPYATFGLYHDVITGLLSSNTGWASAAARCVEAAGGVRVLVDGSSELHPEVVGSMQYSAYVGGCAAVTTEAGGHMTTTVAQGAMTHEFVLIWGSAGRAMTLFDRRTRLGVQRVMPVPSVGEAIQEALDAAYALSGPQGNPLRAVRLAVPSNLGGGTPELAIELKARLVDAGFPAVEIQIGGDLTPESISRYVAAEAPVSLFVVDRYIAAASPARFVAGVKEVDGRSVAVRGMLPGRQPNGRLTIRDVS